MLNHEISYSIDRFNDQLIKTLWVKSSKGFSSTVLCEILNERPRKQLCLYYFTKVLEKIKMLSKILKHLVNGLSYQEKVNS